MEKNRSKGENLQRQIIRWKNEDFLRFTFYEVMVKEKVPNSQENEFNMLAKYKLNNMRYIVYLQDQEFIYNEAKMRVQPNELLIAVKER